MSDTVVYGSGLVVGVYAVSMPEIGKPAEATCYRVTDPITITSAYDVLLQQAQTIEALRRALEARDKTISELAPEAQRTMGMRATVEDLLVEKRRLENKVSELGLEIKRLKKTRKP